jgi:hypothetical protein
MSCVLALISHESGSAGTTKKGGEKIDLPASG